MLLVNMVAAAVVITPENPRAADSLTCDVSDSSATYNYYWYRNDARVKSETGRSSTLSASWTSFGDEIVCRAYRPSTPYTPETYVGRDVTTITNDLFNGLIVIRNNPDLAPRDEPEECEGPECMDMPDDGRADPEECEGPQCYDFGDDYVPQCRDGFDNDADGRTDMGDIGCSSPDDNDEWNPTTQCNDGIDNDGDGLVDFPADPGCSHPLDNSEWNGDFPEAPAQCNDGLDNDADGFVDMNDPGCSSPFDNDEHNDVSNPACSDGLDNDGDAKIDMADPGCTSTQDTSEYNAPEENGGSSSNGARSLDLDMVYALAENGKLVIEYILENDGTMSVKDVELSVQVPDYGITHIEDIGKMRHGKKVYNRLSINLPENAKGTHLVLVEASGLGAHDSEQRTFTVENAEMPNIKVIVFESEATQETVHKGFFARIIEWFLNLFRAVF